MYQNTKRNSIEQVHDERSKEQKEEDAMLAVEKKTLSIATLISGISLAFVLSTGLLGRGQDEGSLREKVGRLEDQVSKIQHEMKMLSASTAANSTHIIIVREDIREIKDMVNTMYKSKR